MPDKGSGCGCCGCSLLSRLVEPDGPGEYEFLIEAAQTRELATGLPGNHWFMEFNIAHNAGPWSIVFRWKDDADNVVLTARFSRGVDTMAVPDPPYGSIALTNTTAEYWSEVESDIEANDRHLVLASGRDFGGRIDRTRRSLTFDHDRPTGDVLSNNPDVCFFPPDSSITVEATEDDPADNLKLEVENTGAVDLRLTFLDMSKARPPFDIPVGATVDPYYGYGDDCFEEPSTDNPECPDGQVTCENTWSGRHLNATIAYTGNWNDLLFPIDNDFKFENTCFASRGGDVVLESPGIGFQAYQTCNVNPLNIDFAGNADAVYGSAAVGCATGSSAFHPDTDYHTGGKVVGTGDALPQSYAYTSPHGVFLYGASASLGRDTIDVSADVLFIVADGNITEDAVGSVWSVDNWAGSPEYTFRYTSDVQDPLEAIFRWSMGPPYDSFAQFEASNRKLKWRFNWSVPHGCLSRPSDRSVSVRLDQASNWSEFNAQWEALVPVAARRLIGTEAFVDWGDNTPTGYQSGPPDGTSPDGPYFGKVRNDYEFWIGFRFNYFPTFNSNRITVTFGDD